MFAAENMLLITATVADLVYFPIVRSAFPEAEIQTSEVREKLGLHFTDGEAVVSVKVLAQPNGGCT